MPGIKVPEISLEDHQSSKEQVYLLHEKIVTVDLWREICSKQCSHFTGDLSRASLHQSESWIFAHENFPTADNLLGGLVNQNTNSHKDWTGKIL